MNRAAICLKTGLTRLPIREALVRNTNQCKYRTFSISNLACVITEIEFRQIPVQVLLRTVLVDALHAGFEIEK
jgi:hypothetical protein